MTSTEGAEIQASRIVERILSVLDEGSLVRRIDHPIDEAVKSFRFVWGDPFSPTRVHRVVGEFVAHVYEHLGARTLKCPRERFGDEAVALLQEGYQGLHETGYDGALLDIVHPVEAFGDGIDGVLAQAADLLKARRRREFTEWVYVRQIDPLDSALRRAIVRHILVGYRALLPDDLLQCEPFELADEIPYLLDSLRAAQTTSRALRSDPLGSPW